MASLQDHVNEVGIQAFISNFYRAMSQSILDTERIHNLKESKYQLRLVYE
ncbi:hypothetical protein GCM10007063_33980 [Lentibacillus kapialis]|uniref:Uncharacterized protein n=1 Tax=Lentibacillus kapialis TaxID=340214 RepID=A0A917V1B2_9BACI|nr:hypothetical protein GCM10007063_33980 [Lentibacillus kapialis]